MNRFYISRAFICLTLGILLLAGPAQAGPPSLKLDSRALQLQNPGDKSLFLGDSRELSTGDLQLDSADDFLMNEDRRSRLFNYYRGLIYLKYFNEWTGIGNYDELESEQLAQSLFIYHGAKTLVDYFEFSPLGLLYEDFLKEVRFYRNMSTVSVERSSQGGFNVDHASEKGDELLKFRVGISTKRGIEPRINIGELLVLRHDLLSEQTLLELRLDF